MAITLNVGALKTRESTSDSWHSSVIKTNAVTDANNISYDSTETYDTGTVGEELVEQKTSLTQLGTNVEYLKSDIGIVEDTNTAQHTIAQGAFVIWKGQLYKAIAPIPAGVALTNSNLTILNGGLNAIVEAVKISVTTTESTLAGTLIYNQRLLFSKQFISPPFIVFSVGTSDANADSQKIGMSWDTVTTQGANIRARALSTVAAGTYYINVLAFELG